MSDIKAIETRYKGYRFRSRLEARWAVFFDAMGLNWEYEPEGFDLGASGWYLPDFYLSKWDMYIEIKPKLPLKDFVPYEPDPTRHIVMLTEGEQHTPTVCGKLIGAYKALSNIDGNHVTERFFMLCGTPGVPRINAMNERWELKEGSLALQPVMLQGFFGGIGVSAFAFVNGGKDLDIWPYYAPNMVWAKDASDLSELWMCGLLLPDRYTPRAYFGDGVFYDDPRLCDAYDAARQARFEHGEHGERQ